jgi:hypothetical protein
LRYLLAIIKTFNHPLPAGCIFPMANRQVRFIEMDPAAPIVKLCVYFFLVRFSLSHQEFLSDAGFQKQSYSVRSRGWTE